MSAQTGTIAGDGAGELLTTGGAAETTDAKRKRGTGAAVAGGGGGSASLSGIDAAEVGAGAGASAASSKRRKVQETEADGEGSGAAADCAPVGRVKRKRGDNTPLPRNAPGHWDVFIGHSRRSADAVVLATGHSALDALLLAREAGARLEPKGFAMGVRAEHPQPWLDERQYGGLRATSELPASFYELTAQAEGRGVYSFCMCPGGFIVPATTAADRVVVNGMSLARRDSPYANSGIVVALEPEDWCGERGRAWGWEELLRAAGDRGELPPEPAAEPLFGARLQQALERLAARAGGGRGRAPAQRADAFLAGRGEAPEPRATSYRPGLAACDLGSLLPRGIAERLREGIAEFGERLPGFATGLGQLVGVESRTSSPVRLARDRESCESPGLRGLYPCGEGAGFAGGIVSAALDGRRVAAALARVLG